MAEPLSVIASVIAVIATAATCAENLSRIIQDIRHAPDELLALSNEINNVRSTVDDAKVACTCLATASSSTTKFIETLERLLKEAERVLDDLNRLVSEYNSKPHIRNRSLWWIRHKNTTKQHLMTLRKIRCSISELLTSANVSVLLL